MKTYKKTFFILFAALLFLSVTAIIITKSREVHYADLQVFQVESSPVLVIDPGHGGLDGGAVSVSGQKESEINLAIAKKLWDISQIFGINAILTRTTEDLIYPDETDTIREKKVWDQKQRVELINSVQGAVLISVHQNTYPSQGPSGTQVLYGQVAGSEDFGKIAHENLLRYLCPENRRVAAPISEKIYLMREIHCPAILAECGFLSNPREAKLLLDESYQISIASVLCASYLQFIY